MFILMALLIASASTAFSRCWFYFSLVIAAHTLLSIGLYYAAISFNDTDVKFLYYAASLSDLLCAHVLTGGRSIRTCILSLLFAFTSVMHALTGTSIVGNHEAYIFAIDMANISEIIIILTGHYNGSLEQPDDRRYIIPSSSDGRPV